MQYNTQLVTLFGEIMNEISQNEIESVAQLESKLKLGILKRRQAEIRRRIVLFTVLFQNTYVSQCKNNKFNAAAKWKLIHSAKAIH